MGLDVSHDAFSGAYSAFNRLRAMICRAAGGSWPPHTDPELLKSIGVDSPQEGWWYVPDDVTKESHPGLYAFLCHSDCDGEFSPAECAAVADDLEKILPRITELDDGDVSGGVSFKKTAEGIEVGHHPGHLARAGGYAGATKKFIAGCRAAAASNEQLTFG